MAIALEPSDVGSVCELYERGQCLQAYARAQQLGPLREWSGAEALLIAGRLAINLGAPRLGRVLHYRCWKAQPRHAEARYYRALGVLDRFGPLRVCELMRRTPELSGAAPQTQAHWLALRACASGYLRDFDAAEAALGRAETLSPRDPWLAVQWSHLLALEDKHQESLAAARAALQWKPWYPPAVRSVAHALAGLDRAEEAIAFLLEADRRIENGPAVAQLAELQLEREKHDDARRSLDRYEQLSPLLEEDLRHWLNGRRSDAAYYAGEFKRAAEFARKAGSPFLEKIAERLESGAPGQRTQLPVAFVQQHHATCVPATLTALGRFWGRPVDHVALADEICYDGTPDHASGKWARESGWLARDFTVTWEAAVALLERGVPFALSTVNPVSAHMQAVVGCDTRRGTLLVRDPSFRVFFEYEGRLWLERYQPSGPRGMVLIPPERAALLEGLALPDSALHERYQLMQEALLAHDRARARAELEALDAQAPGHWLTWKARWSLAFYDGDRTQMLAATEGWLKLFPHDPALKLRQLSHLAELSRRQERLKLLEEACAGAEADISFSLLYAQELRSDARLHEKSLSLLRRILRYRPEDARACATLAHVYWDRLRREEALELYRFAACLEDKGEEFAYLFFRAARGFKRADDALLFLRQRFERFGKKSSGPARTLFSACEDLERLPEAFAHLDAALALRPDDGELLLYAAEAHARYGRFEKGDELIRAAEPRSKRTRWLRSAAALAGYRGELRQARDCWMEVTAAEPLAMDAHGALARLIAETSGRAEALDYLYRLATRFPYHYGIHQLCTEWLRAEEAEECAPFLQHMVDIDPQDGWVRREWGWTLVRMGRYEEALAEAEAAVRLEPYSAASYGLRGDCLNWLGRAEEARAEFRRAIQLSVDYDYAIDRLLECCPAPADKRQALTFVYQELVRQVIFGDGLLAYRNNAKDVLSDDELLAVLQEGLSERPDLWHAWSAVVRQLADMGRLEQAHTLARQATERFPLLPRLWLDLAMVCLTRGDRSGQKEALEQALRINPAWGVAARSLAEVCGHLGERARAREVLEKAVALTPLDPENHVALAEVLWSAGEKEPALARAEQAVRLDPACEWAWSRIGEWSGALRQPERAVMLARELTRSRAGEARSWLILARALAGPEDLAERLHALDRAIELNPRFVEAHDLKAACLAEAGRYDQAAAACRPQSHADKPPVELLGRAAWIERLRGNGQAAVEQMRAALAEAPGYYWGWARLADWLAEDQDNAGYLQAATQMARLAPRNPVPYGYLGEAQVRNKDRAAAKASFRRALELGPDYSYAGLSLFDLQLEDLDWPGAAQTLDILRRHAPGPLVWARQVQLAAKRGNLDDALAALGELAVCDTDDTWPFDSAVETIGEKGWVRPAAERLIGQLDNPNAGRLLGRALMALLLSGPARPFWHQGLAHILRAMWRWRFMLWRRKMVRAVLAKIAGKGELERRALTLYLESTSELGRADELRRFITGNARLLRQDARLWGAAAYALTNTNQHLFSVQWTEDWRVRPGVQPWMLLNRAASLRSLARWSDAHEVSLRALDLPRDHASDKHSVWAALDEALAGDGPGAAARLSRIRPADLPPYYRFLHALASAAAKAAPRGAAPAAAWWRAACQDVRRALAAMPNFAGEPELRRAYRRVLWKLAQSRGGVLAYAWTVCRL